jgi:two-component system, chemotaxis family, chemotaxis protein CheY
LSWLVLVVEDDDDIRDTLTTVLDARGLSTIGARHGRDAFDKIAERAARPAVILLDLMMPVMDGETFLREQERDALLAGVPVIVMTALLNPPTDMPDTVQAVLRKPVTLPDLLDRIQHACGSVNARGTGPVPAIDRAGVGAAMAELGAPGAGSAIDEPASDE